jgi:hypothetical protein
MSGTLDWSYSYTDPSGNAVSITITTTDVGVSTPYLVSDPTASNPEPSYPAYLATGVTGTYGGVAISGLVAPGGYDDNDNLLFAGTAYGLDVSGLSFVVNGADINLFYTDGVYNGAYGEDDFNTLSNTQFGENTDLSYTPAAICYVGGTRIRVPDGEAEVASLAAGDVVTLAGGGTARIRWIGRRVVATRFADPLKVMPIRIRSGALGQGLPVRDLLVSPCHGLLVDGVLVQAGALVNGASILRDRAMPEFFTYYHVELATHELILAEGVPAETFVDNVDRLGFDNWADHQAQFGDAEITEMPYPRAKSARQLPTAIRARLAILAEAA